jgi:hypothetical protein
MRPFVLRLALVLWAVCTMFAPPGLPACWLEQQPCEFHVHFSQEQAETPHTHFYLIDLAQGMAAQPLPFVHLETAWLLLLLSLSGVKLWWKNNRSSFSRCDWALIPEPPPPRHSPAS